MSLLKIEDLTFRHGGPVSLTVHPGECLALSGPSGAGKTLLLRAVADLDPHGGRLWLNGTESHQFSAPDWRRRVGMLPAESAWWHDTVGDHFKKAPGDILTRLGFDHAVLSWPVSRLSSGEKQRLSLVRLLANQPEALLLDEPTASLDAHNILRVEELIAAYRRRHQTPVLWVSHDPAQIARVADRCLLLADGNLTEGSLCA